MKNAILLAAIVAAVQLMAAAPKNIILFIGDGMSVPQRMTADEFARKTGRPDLALNRLPHQATTRTCSADSLVTDSAASATAIACGSKARNSSLGVDADGKPVYSCATLAKSLGKRVGMVTTVTINHATPAGFYAHRKSRGNGYGIGLDLLASGFDYFAGGGAFGHDDKSNPEYRGDIYELAKAAGYRFAHEDRAAFDALRPGSGKVWYVASRDCMPFSIDAGEWKGVPTLAELTAKGIELLENDRGFFMMVEGGKIDHAGHANDVGANLHDLLALDDAVRVALEYQRRHPDTLIVTTGDHETGGMTMGFAGTGYALYVERIAHQKRSAASIPGHMARQQVRTLEDLRPYLEENFGFRFEGDAKQNPMALTAAEREELQTALAHDLAAAKAGLKDDERYDGKKISRLPTAVKRIFSHKCGVSWTSGAHTALPVLTTAGGPGAERFAGYLDNTDIAKILKSLLENR